MPGSEGEPAVGDAAAAGAAAVAVVDSAAAGAAAVAAITAAVLVFVGD